MHHINLSDAKNEDAWVYFLHNLFFDKLWFIGWQTAGVNSEFSILMQISPALLVSSTSYTPGMVPEAVGHVHPPEPRENFKKWFLNA